jgi:hypothetical protein
MLFQIGSWQLRRDSGNILSLDGLLAMLSEFSEIGQGPTR